MCFNSIVDRVEIADVLRFSGRLEPNARGWFLAPCHLDKTPSGHIVPNTDKRRWYCFPCGRGGGILDLAVLVGLGHDRASAARILEERAGR